MRTIHVAAAIIEKDGKILIAQRKKGDLAGLWEFPGGKIEANESSEHAIVREIEEELDIEIVVVEYLTTVEYQYESFYLIMECFICNIESGELTLHDHTAFRWILPCSSGIEWVPADVKVINEYRKKKGTK